MNLDYDTSQFQVPRRVEGDAIVTFTLAVHSPGTANVEAGGDVYLRRWDGTTETQLATAQIPRISAGAGNTTSTLMNIPLSISNTIIKKGEQIRLSFEILGTGLDNDNNVWVIIGNDPTGRTGVYISGSDSISTKMLTYVPFKIDVS
jgi:hypothetical protein